MAEATRTMPVEPQAARSGGLPSARLAWVLFGLAAGTTAAAIVLILLNDARTSVSATIVSDLAALTIPLVGALIAANHPRNAIGWILLGVGLIFGPGNLVLEYAWYSIAERGGTLPLDAELLWLTVSWWAPALGLIGVYALLLFPDGRPPSPRWRPVAWVAGAGIGLIVLVRPFLDEPNHSFPGEPANPFVIDGAQPVLAAAFTVAGAAFLLMVPVSAVGLVVRLRRSRGVEREQLKWFAFGGALLAASVVVGMGFEALGHPEVRGNVIGFGIMAVPIAAGIAILRHGLYDIDVVISKTLVFALLAGFVTAVYVAFVFGVGALVGSRGSPILSAAAAAAVAVAFQPVRGRARHLANRLVYGERSTPYEVLSEFADRVSGTYSVEDVLPRMAHILAEGTGAASVGIWLLVGDELRPAAGWPPAGDPAATPGPITVVGDGLPELPGAAAYPVTHDGELLGAITVSVPSKEAITPAEEKLVRDLASQAGLLVRNVRLTEELRARLEDLRASRERLVRAQDEERRRLERDLHDGAQQQFVALSVQLGIAEGLARTDPDGTAELLAALKAQAGEALENLRDLARGIYPPLLADRGLAAALESQARKAAVPTDVVVGTLGRYPEEVEAAVYFCCLEALQNVAKYASASRAEVRVEEVGGEIRFSVSDDGVGFDPATVARGAGTTNMADRLEALGGSLEVTSASGFGTTVSGRIPLPG